MSDPVAPGPSRPREGVSDADAALLAGIRGGDPAAFDRFVERFGPMILAFGLRMCGHRQDAEDVFQETLVKVYTQLHALEEPAALKGWLWRIVANECLMSRRGPRDPSRAIGFDDVRRGPDAPAFDPADDGAKTPEDQAIRAEERTRVEEALRHLSPEYRIIVLLRDFEGLSTDEVATALGLSVSNAKVRLHRARAALRRQLAAGTDGAAEVLP